MKILIVEDEELAVKKLKKTLASVEANAEVVGEADSVKQTVSWLEQNPAPDLILMDVELSDGQSFEVFNQVKVKAPVIFITSYDEYALKAFKVNSVDYLLKPVQREDLETALRKFREMKDLYRGDADFAAAEIDALVKKLHHLETRDYRKRFLVKQGQKMVSVEVQEIAYFYSDGRLNFFKTSTGKKYVVDYTMDELGEMLDPAQFFRISRSFFISISSVAQIHEFQGNRLILDLLPESEKEAIVSREKVTDFKKWMGK